MARFERKGADGSADLSAEKLQIEDSSSEDEQQDVVEDEPDANYVRASPKKRRERPQSFSAMGDIKNKWEGGQHRHEGYQTRKEELAEERKEELQRIRAKLFAGRQVRMKEAYEQAVQEGQQQKDSPRVLDVQVEVTAKSIKEIFEKGTEDISPTKPKIQDEMEVFEAATAKESRNIFKQLDENARREDLGTPLRRSMSQRIGSELRPDHRVPSREELMDPEKEAAANTTSKMRNIFRQMEQQAGREDLPQGPKPLKRFTPPPECARESESEGEEDEEDGEEELEDEEEEEEEVQVETKKSSVEDELIQIAKERALAKNLRSKFEHWEGETEKENRLNRKSPSPLITGDDQQASLDTARNLRARFEALQQESSKPAEKPRPKVHRFVESKTSSVETCGACGKKVYAMEKMEVTQKIYHRNCFRCTHCSCVLRLENFSLNNGRFYCSPHFKQLFIAKGNYDEGFGGEPAARKWHPKKSAPAAEVKAVEHSENEDELFDKIADSNGHDSALEEALFDE